MKWCYLKNFPSLVWIDTLYQLGSRNIFFWEIKSNLRNYRKRFFQGSLLIRYDILVRSNWTFYNFNTYTYLHYIAQSISGLGKSEDFLSSFRRLYSPSAPARGHLRSVVGCPTDYAITDNGNIVVQDVCVTASQSRHRRRAASATSTYSTQHPLTGSRSNVFEHFLVNPSMWT